MTTVNEAVSFYIAAWNETDPARRGALVARAWDEGGAYLDGHREAEGHEAIAAMIGEVQARFPGYRFRLSSGIEAHKGNARFAWQAGGTAEAPLFFADRLRGAGPGRAVRAGGRVHRRDAAYGAAAGLIRAS